MRLIAPPKNATAAELENSTAATQVRITGQVVETDSSATTCVVACSPSACSCPSVALKAAELAHTRAMLLPLPEVPTLDAVLAWGHRLRRGVETNIITRREATEAWRRAVVKVGVLNGLDA